MTGIASKNDWLELKGSVTLAVIGGLRGRGCITRLALTEGPLLTARSAQALTRLESVTWLWLWRSVTRTAMRHVIAVPGLETLDVLQMTRPGRLEGFASAQGLKVFRAYHCLTEEDLLEVALCRSLRELGAQSAGLSMRVIDALLAMPDLVALDLEASGFDDAMAERLSASKTLTSLDLGNTRLTRKGLASLCRMSQLRSLDLWATALDEADLDLLLELPRIEYLSVGHVEGDCRFDSQTLIQRLMAMPSLRRIWLDGVPVSQQQREALEARYESVRIT